MTMHGSFSLPMQSAPHFFGISFYKGMPSYSQGKFSLLKPLHRNDGFAHLGSPLLNCLQVQILVVALHAALLTVGLSLQETQVPSQSPLQMYLSSSPDRLNIPSCAILNRNIGVRPWRLV